MILWNVECMVMSQQMRAEELKYVIVFACCCYLFFKLRIGKRVDSDWIASTVCRNKAVVR
jgi:hypothetical protein